jgi:glutaredoxin-related protein
VSQGGGAEFQVKRNMRDNVPYLFLHVHLISLVIDYLTKSMEKTACPITNICRGCQKIHHILWTEEVHYHFLNIMPLVHLLKKMNSFHTHSPYFTNYLSRQIILLNSSVFFFISHTIF